MVSEKINIIDVEASGLHFDSYPIEVAVLINGKTKSWLIKPEPNWTYWCKLAESIHGITRQQLKEEGQSAQQVANELDKLMQNSSGIIYSDAVQWDTDWIDTLFFVSKFPKQFHIDSIYDLLEGDQVELFKNARSRIAESGKYRVHRAEEDVKLIFDAYIEVTENVY